MRYKVKAQPKMDYNTIFWPKLTKVAKIKYYNIDTQVSGQARSLPTPGPLRPGQRRRLGSEPRHRVVQEHARSQVERLLRPAVKGSII
jgi:hypothetical protein